MMKIKMEHLTFCGMNHTILKELTSIFFKCNRKKEEQQRWKFCNHSSSASKFTKWWLISLPCINMLFATKWALGCKIYRCQTTDCIKKMDIDNTVTPYLCTTVLTFQGWHLAAAILRVLLGAKSDQKVKLSSFHQGRDRL